MPVNLPPPDDLAPVAPPVLLPGGATAPVAPPVLIPSGGTPTPGTVGSFVPITPPIPSGGAVLIPTTPPPFPSLPPSNLPQTPPSVPAGTQWASQAEAEAGNSANVMMSPLRTKQAIDAKLLPVLGPDDNAAMQDLIRAFHGLNGPRPLFLASGHNGAPERPVLGVSYDGKQFVEIAVSYTPPVGDNCRDCSIAFIKGRFYMCYTAGAFGAVDYFGIAVSDDLLTWAHHCDVPTPVATGPHTWAPEWVIDGNKIHITYSKMHGGGVWKTSYTTANDDSLLTWVDGGFVGGTGATSEIDANVIRWDRSWLLLAREYSGGSGSGLKLFRSTTSPVGGYTLLRTILNNGPKEGPSITNMGDGRLRAYYKNDPAGAGDLSFSDSLDGGITWSTPEVVTGSLVPIDHITVLSFLDPAHSEAVTAPAIVDMGRETALVRHVTGTSENFDFSPADIISVRAGYSVYSIEVDVLGYASAHGFSKRYKFVVAAYGAGTVFNELVSTVVVDTVPGFFNLAFTLADPVVTGGVIRWALETVFEDAPLTGVKFYFRTRPIG